MARPAGMRGRSKRHVGGVHVVDVPRSAFVADVTAEIALSGLTLDRFIALGQSDELDDDRLRDLWLMAGPIFR